MTSPSTVGHTPYVQDLQYIGASSLRNGFIPRGTEPGTPPTAATSEVSLTPVADTYVDENAPSNNFDWSSQMMARGTKGSRALLRFDLPAAPTGMTLSSATLAMRTTTGADAGSAAPAAVTTFGGTWSEQDVTWGTRPQGPATTLGSFPAGTAPDTAERGFFRSVGA